MGVFRLILAIAVVVAHSAAIPGLPLLGGSLAVKTFFMVSGFYMAMILSEKYQARANGVWLFFSNRFLRIYPIYWLVLATEMAFALAGWSQSANDQRLPLQQLIHTHEPLAFLAIAASQITLFGQELVSLFSWTDAEGFQWFTTTTPATAARGHEALLMPHAWTLACEVVFYVCAPWLNRLKSFWLMCVVGLNILISTLLPRWIDPKLAEVANDYWAPLQMGFFTAGMLAWRCRSRWPVWFDSTKFSRLLASGLVALVIGFDLLAQFTTRGSLWLLYLAAFAGIPALFSWSHRSHLDRQLGDLSYPVYLIHVLVIRCMKAAAESGALPDSFMKSVAFPLTAITVSCVTAWLLARAIEHPLDLWRQQRLGRAARVK